MKSSDFGEWYINAIFSCLSTVNQWRTTLHSILSEKSMFNRNIYSLNDRVIAIHIVRNATLFSNFFNQFIKFYSSYFIASNRHMLSGIQSFLLARESSILWESTVYSKLYESKKSLHKEIFFKLLDFSLSFPKAYYFQSLQMQIILCLINVVQLVNGWKNFFYIIISFLTQR